MTCSRRDVIRAIGGAVAATAATGCVRRTDPANLAELPLQPGCKLSVPVARFPDLSRDGGALLVQAPQMADPILIVRRTSDAYAVFQGVCPHAGCPLGIADGRVTCPCHDSQFDPTTGSVLRAPARYSLGTYDSYLDTTTGDLIVDVMGRDKLPAPASGTIELSLQQYPDLQTDFGTVQGGIPGCCQPLLVARLPGGQFAAVDPTCTHLHCEVLPQLPDPKRDVVDPSAPKLICPCHRSIFEFTGAVLQGPATAPLRSFPVTSDGTSVRVDVSAVPACKTAG